MAIVVRVLIHRGTEDQLKSWLNLSVADGSTTLSGLTVQTIYSDFELVRTAPTDGASWDGTDRRRRSTDHD